MKDTIIITVILFIIIGGHIYTRNFLNKTVLELEGKIEELKEEIFKGKEIDNKQNIINIVNDLEIKWKEVEEKWAIIVIHDELDSIETSLMKIKSNIETEELNKALEEIEVSAFLINHITEREKFCLKNIF